MPCDYPQKALLFPKKGGKHPKPQLIKATQDLNNSDFVEYIIEKYGTTSYDQIELKCGKCKGCRLDRSRDWAIRLMHEKHIFPEAIFVTFTYDDEHLPPNGTLVDKDFRLFMKRLRKKYQGVKSVVMPNGKTQNPIRYFMSGEYGTKRGRPHYHAIIFNYRPFDEVPCKQTPLNPLGDAFYTSSQLTKTWGNGYVNYSEVTQESCNYVAQYIMKKVTGEMAEDHYKRYVEPYTDHETGEILDYIKLKPEFSAMTTQPGIGYFFYKKYPEMLHPDIDRTTVKSKKGIKEVAVPRYYLKQLQKTNAEQAHLVTEKRRDKMELSEAKDAQRLKDGLPSEKSPERRRVQRIVRDATVKSLQRRLG
jgi:hypothetical protein